MEARQEPPFIALLGFFKASLFLSFTIWRRLLGPPFASECRREIEEGVCTFQWEVLTTFFRNVFIFQGQFSDGSRLLATDSLLSLHGIAASAFLHSGGHHHAHTPVTIFQEQPIQFCLSFYLQSSICAWHPDAWKIKVFSGIHSEKLVQLLVISLPLTPSNHNLTFQM